MAGSMDSSSTLPAKDKQHPYSHKVASTSSRHLSFSSLLPHLTCHLHNWRNSYHFLKKIYNKFSIMAPLSQNKMLPNTSQAYSANQMQPSTSYQPSMQGERILTLHQLKTLCLPYQGYRPPGESRPRRRRNQTFTPYHRDRSMPSNTLTKEEHIERTTTPTMNSHDPSIKHSPIPSPQPQKQPRLHKSQRALQVEPEMKEQIQAQTPLPHIANLPLRPAP